ncbi:MAG: rod shape-determining protein MreC [Alphaproteobacteria bacterium]|nr:rod shape-determining protein MreC [Alphaproteobacteria bacterium]
MRSRLQRIHLLKTLYQQFKLYIYLFLAVALLIFGLSDHPMIAGVREKTSAAGGYVARTLYVPVGWAEQGLDYLKELWAVRNQNVRLRQENSNLLYWQNQVERLQMENEALKKQLSFVSPEEKQYKTVGILVDNGGPYARSVLVQGGRKDGIQKGDVALYQAAVFGRVVHVGRWTSRLLLLTDFTSRVPVMVGQQKYLGVVEGDNTTLLTLTALPENAEVKKGDYVMTSGHGGVYPVGLAVGTVVSVSEDAIKVAPFVRQEEVVFVRLMNLGLGGLLPDKDCEKE